MAFPSNPSHGDIFERFGRKYNYDSAKGKWSAVKSLPASTLASLSSSLIPAAGSDIDLGTSSNRIKNLYLDATSTITIGDRVVTADSFLNFNLEVLPEVLEIQVDSPAAGHGHDWLWTWTTSALPYARINITNQFQPSVPLYRQGTYTINNFAHTLHDAMTQTHEIKLKWIEGAGDQNLVDWVTYSTVNTSHPDINGGASTEVTRLSVNVPATITPPTLVAPTVTYNIGATTGAYTFTGTRMGQNQDLGPLRRGGTYTFILDGTASGHPFYLTTDNGTNFAPGAYFGEYTSGVTGSRTDVGTITFTVPLDAPDTLYYQCGNHSSMRGVITIKDLAVEVNNNGNYVIYAQHSQEGHFTPIELRPVPVLSSQMCLVYDSNTSTFVPQDLATYVERTPAFKNKIQEVAGTATLVAPDGTSLVASVEIYTDASYLPYAGNSIGDIAFAQDTGRLYVWNGNDWEQSGLTPEDIDKNATLNHTGVLTAYTGTARWYPPKGITITRIVARVDTAPVGSDIVVQLNKTSGETTTNQQVTITDSTNKTVVSSPSLTLLEDDYLTVDIVSVGSTTAGKNLRLTLTYK